MCSSGAIKWADENNKKVYSGTKKVETFSKFAVLKKSG